MHAPVDVSRADQLLRSPAGCALLVMAAESRLIPAQIVEPATSLHLIASSIGEIIPWKGNHDVMVATLLLDGAQHRTLAESLVREPGIERWWAPLDRDRQVWLEWEGSPVFPEANRFPTPTHPPSPFEIYAQHPHPQLLTSSDMDSGLTSRLASFIDHASDAPFQHPARRRHLRIASDARVYDVATAEDWHALVIEHGVRSKPGYQSNPQHPPETMPDFGQPWGPNYGLVPDWQAIAREWDGVHVTLWALLTALQVRIESEAGWTEPWSWEAEETIWLHRVFEEVSELPSIEHPLPDPPYFAMPRRYWGW